MEILLMLDAYFFTMKTVDKLLKDADADGDGEVHYAEFAAWLAGAHCDAVVRNLFTASLATMDEQDFETNIRVATGPKADELYVEVKGSSVLEQPRRASFVPG